MFGIVFDLDGVLLNSTHAHAQAYRETLAEFAGIRLRYEAIAGMRTDEAICRVLDEAQIPPTADLVERLVIEKRRRAAHILRETKPLVAGCADAVSRLGAQWPLALATSASYETASVFFEVSGLRESFRVVVCGPDVERGKPAPDLILLSCKRLALGVSSVVLVEDATNGVRAGRLAGVRVLGILGTEPADALLDAGASAVVPDLPAVVETLERWARE